MLYKVKIVGFTQTTQIFFAGVIRRTAMSVGTAAPSLSARRRRDTLHTNIRMPLLRMSELKELRKVLQPL